MTDSASMTTFTIKGNQLTITGAIKSMDVPHLTEHLKKLRTTTTGNVKVLMKDVTMLHSTGLTALLDAHLMMERYCRDFTLVLPSPTVRKLLSVANLSNVFHIVTNNESE